MSEVGIVAITIPVDTLKKRIRDAVIELTRTNVVDLKLNSNDFSKIVNRETDAILLNIITGHSEARGRG